MTTNFLIDGAVVHTGATADTAQHLLEFATQKTRAAAIDEHHIHMVGPIRLAGGSNTGEQRNVIRDRLAGCASRKKADHRCKILEGWQNLLDPRDGNVHARHHGTHALVALIRHNGYRTCLCN